MTGSTQPPQDAEAAERERLLGLVRAASVPFWDHVGITAEEESAEVGHVRLNMPMRPELGTRFTDVMHGGAISTLIDAAAATCSSTLQRAGDEWSGLVTTDLNVSYLNAARSDVVAEARAIRSGRTIAFIQVDVHDAGGTHVASGRVTYLILRPR